VAAEYRIFETNRYLADMEDIRPPHLRNGVRANIAGHVYPQLRKQPHFSPNIRKMRGVRSETWRFRVGRFRLFYSIDDDALIVSMLAIAPRKDAYSY